MENKRPSDQQILDAKISPVEERWSPGRDNPAVSIDEGVLRTLAKVDDGARRAVLLAEDWKGNEVPGNRISEFTRKLPSGKTLKNLDCQGKGPEGKLSFGGKKTTYEKWPLTAWIYLRYLCPKKHRNKPLIQIAMEEKVYLNFG